MTREKFQNALYLTGEFLTAFVVILGVPFAGCWLKYIFCG